MCTRSYVNEPLMFIDDHTIFYFILLFIKNVYCSNKPPMTLIARIIVFCFFIEREKQKLYAFRLSLTNRNSIWSYLNKQIQKWELGDYFVLFIGVCDFDLKQLNSVNKCFFFFSVKQLMIATGCWRYEKCTCDISYLPNKNRFLSFIIC